MRQYDDYGNPIAPEEQGTIQPPIQEHVIVRDGDGSSATILFVLTFLILGALLVWGLFYTDFFRTTTKKIGVDVNVTAPANTRPANR